MLGSSDEGQVPHRRIFHFPFARTSVGGEGKKINQYLLGISEMDWNAITAPIPREYKIHEVILELISSDITLPYEDKNGLQQWIKCPVTNTKKTEIKQISVLQTEVYTPVSSFV